MSLPVLRAGFTAETTERPAIYSSRFQSLSIMRAKPMTDMIDWHAIKQGFSYVLRQNPVHRMHWEELNSCLNRLIFTMTHPQSVIPERHPHFQAVSGWRNR